MTAPLYSDDDFTDRLVGLLPRGRVWPREFNAIVRATMKGCAPAYRRNMERGNALLVDGFPATTVELLTEWEKTLGLPDPCTGPAPTILARQAQVLVRFAKSGGQTAAYFIALAAALGYPITITEYSAAFFGMRFGRPMAGPDWTYVWQVNAPLYGIQRFKFGGNRMGDRFSTFGNDVLECELQAVKPAHTLLLFSYT